MTERSLALIPRGFTEISQLAESLSKSALLPDALKKKPEDIMFTVMAGAELGLSPIASIRGIYVIQGKPVLSADAMVGLILGSGHCEYFVQTDASATSVTFETKRKGAPVVQKCTWTSDDAKRAGLNTKDNWRMFPRQMLAARAKAELARTAYSDILAGCYDPDELESTPVRDAPSVTVDNSDAVDAEIVQTDEQTFALIDSAETTDQLKALAESFKTLPEATKVEARKRYTARWDVLVAPAPAEAVA